VSRLPPSSSAVEEAELIIIISKLSLLIEIFF